MREFITQGFAQPSLQFYNTRTQQLQRDIWVELQDGLWQEYNIDNRLYNDSMGEVRIVEWKHVFPTFYPIYSGFGWDTKQSK